MPVTEAIRELIVDRAPLVEIRKTACYEGMRTLQEEGGPAGPGRRHHGRRGPPVDLHGGDCDDEIRVCRGGAEREDQPRDDPRAESREDAELALYEKRAAATSG